MTAFSILSLFMINKRSHGLLCNLEILAQLTIAIIASTLPHATTLPIACSIIPKLHLNPRDTYSLLLLLLLIENATVFERVKAAAYGIAQCSEFVIIS